MYTCAAYLASSSGGRASALASSPPPPLTAHQWTPTVTKELEYIQNELQWLLLNPQGDRKCAFLHCYIACQTNKSDGNLFAEIGNKKDMERIESGMSCFDDNCGGST